MVTSDLNSPILVIETNYGNQLMAGATKHNISIPLEGVVMKFPNAEFGEFSGDDCEPIFSKFSEIVVGFLLNGSAVVKTPHLERLIKPLSTWIVPSPLTHQTSGLQGSQYLKVYISIEGDHDRRIRQILYNWFKGSPAVSSDAADCHYACEIVNSLNSSSNSAQWNTLRIASLIRLWILHLFEEPLQRDEYRQMSEGRKVTASDIRCLNICRTAIAYMNGHFSDGISLNQVASHVNLSQRHLHRVFHSYLNSSPKTVLTTIQLKHARKLLTNNPNIRVKEVCYACGFSEPQHFSKSYKSVYNELPSETKFAYSNVEELEFKVDNS